MADRLAAAAAKRQRRAHLRLLQQRRRLHQPTIGWRLVARAVRLNEDFMVKVDG